MIWKSLLMDLVDKRVFGYPAGKASMRTGLVKMVPSHQIFVEPFCGSANVFFAKQRSKKEVISDLDANVVEAFKAIQTLSASDEKALQEKEWKGSKKHFQKLLKSAPTAKVDKLYKFLYLSAFSYMRTRKSFAPDREGVTTRIADRAIKAKDRLKDVTIKQADYADVVKEYDSKDTVFFFDPPYPGTSAGVGEGKFDEDRFLKVLKDIKGKFICTYGVKGKSDFSGTGFNVQKVDIKRSLANVGGLSREKLITTLIVSNFAAPTYKAFEGTGADISSAEPAPDMVSVTKTSGGAHSHFLDRKNKETAVDGQHSHLFSWIPNSRDKNQTRPRLLSTLYDGPHDHKLAKEDSEETKDGGKHRHKIQIWDYDFYGAESMVLNTEMSEGHSHKLLVSYTVSDGMHSHQLKLPDGTTLKSLTPGEYSQLTKADEFNEFPAAGVHVAALKMRFAGGKVAADFWFENGQGALGWSFDVQRGEIALEKAEDVASSFAISGSMHLLPMADQQVDATPLGKTDLGVLSLDGEVEGGKVLHSDSCEIENGLHTEFSHEYFLRKGAELCGVLDVIHSYVDGWTARIRKENLVPAVLSRRALIEKWMPPDGVSALPESLEEQIPEELRYWLHKGEEARTVRDALILSEMISKDNLALVNGEIRLVEKEVSLYEPPERQELSSNWQVSMLKARSGVEVNEIFSPSSFVPNGSGVFMDLCDQSTEEISKRLSELSDCWHFAVSCSDSDENRELLCKHGRPFRIIPSDPRNAVDVSKRIFLTSFPLFKCDGVRWVLPVTKVAVSEEPDLKEDLTLESELAKFTGEISFVGLNKADEERYVLGVVLEPETTDSQGDIYSEDEIRKSAHGWMEKYQNIGLQHRTLVNKKVKVLESYVAPVEIKIGKEVVKKGTWLLGTRVLDDAMWRSVKKGELTGYSIGGEAIRTPVT